MSLLFHAASIGALFMVENKIHLPWDLNQNYYLSRSTLNPLSYWNILMCNSSIFVTQCIFTTVPVNCAAPVQTILNKQPDQLSIICLFHYFCQESYRTFWVNIILIFFPNWLLKYIQILKQKQEYWLSQFQQAAHGETLQQMILLEK